MLRLEFDIKIVGLGFDVSSKYLPKYDPINPRGEDCHFTTPKTIGVADGFGGWEITGVEAGQFARKLIKNLENAARKSRRNRFRNPKNILTKAYSKTKIAGSSTALLITLSGNILKAAVVGDSGFIIIRDGKVVYGSPLKIRSFNIPYLLRMGNPGCDTNLAEEIEVSVEVGDVIIAGTDGLFCNMHEAELEEVIKGSKKLGLSSEKVASVIAYLAQRNSQNTRADTPFSRAAMAAGYNHSGGKSDDITVIVANVRLFK